MIKKPPLLTGKENKDDKPNLPIDFELITLL
jgi:hypothetical protein